MQGRGFYRGGHRAEADGGRRGPTRRGQVGCVRRWPVGLAGATGKGWLAGHLLGSARLVARPVRQPGIALRLRGRGAAGAVGILSALLTTRASESVAGLPPALRVLETAVARAAPRKLCFVRTAYCATCRQQHAILANLTKELLQNVSWHRTEFRSCGGVNFARCFRTWCACTNSSCSLANTRGDEASPSPTRSRTERRIQRIPVAKRSCVHGQRPAWWAQLA